VISDEDELVVGVFICIDTDDICVEACKVGCIAARWWLLS
jgi:hypothetical protein